MIINNNIFELEVNACFGIYVVSVELRCTVSVDCFGITFGNYISLKVCFFSVIHHIRHCWLKQIKHSGGKFRFIFFFTAKIYTFLRVKKDFVVSFSAINC